MIALLALLPLWFGPSTTEVSAIESAPVAGAPAAFQGPSKRLNTWRLRFLRSPRGVDYEAEEDLVRIFGALRIYAKESAEARQEAALGLFDLLSTAHDVRGARDPGRAAGGQRVLDLVVKEADLLVTESLARWIAGEVLVSRETHSVKRRAAAALFVRNVQMSEVRLALMLCAREGEPVLREAAFEALVLWNEEGIHAIFQEALTGNSVLEPTPAPLMLLAEHHFAGIELPRGSRAIRPLAKWVQENLVHSDWREASRAVATTKALADQYVVDHLINALETWISRAETGIPVRRLQHEITQELRRRSGLKINEHPGRWRTWWRAVKAGQVNGKRSKEDGPVHITEAVGFFGLRPVTDRVVFVIDKSGSMDAPFRSAQGSTASRNRYKAAIDQMVVFLEGMGESARFNVVLFSDGASSWRSSLQPATAANLRTARNWLGNRRPKGGTQLRTGVEKALRMKKNGSVPIADLEVDTIIILCDGATSEGPGWVTPVLKRFNAEARIIVHGVQIGGGGDGTLQRLARETGGEFARVNP